MPTTPITNPISGESLVGTEPQLLQQVDPGWRHRLNLFTGRALTDTALKNEQKYRSSLLTTLGQSVTPGTIKGLALTIESSGADPLLVVTPGYGIAASGMDVALLRTLKTRLSTLAVIDGASGNVQLTFHEFVSDPTHTTNAGILILQSVSAEVSGQAMDTGTGPIEVSGNLGASCDMDPEEYAFEDWQIADGARLVFLPWPAGVPALPLPDRTPEATWRNRLAYAIFEAEALLGPDDQLPWAMLGVPLALIAFDPGVEWKPTAPFALGQLITDPNSNIQQVQTAGTSGGKQPTTWNTAYGGTTTDGTVTWVNNGLAWKPLFVDCSAVVRAGGLPRRRNVFPTQPPPLLQWQSNTPFALGDFILDSNGSIQKVQTKGTSGGPPPSWKTTFGQTTSDGTVIWVNNGAGSWEAKTTYNAGQFIFDRNDNIQQVLIAGTSDNAEPDWNGIYLPTQDGTITWINNGSGNPPNIQPGLAQARIAQLSEQLSQIMSQRVQFKTLADICPTLPPSGILPSAALDFVNHKATWFPPNWSITAAPVHLEELESVLKTGMTAALIEAQTAKPADPTLIEPVEVLVPLPDAVYDPKILVTEKVAPVFQQEVDKATQARNLTLQRIKTVQEELNTLFGVLGPNVPTNPNLTNPDLGLTQQEIQGRNLPPPYIPASTETFGTRLPSTWRPFAVHTLPTVMQFTVGQFIIDGNGNIQVVVQGTEPWGTTEPVWQTTPGQTTQDGQITWLNNGPWTWRPDTAYVPGQFVVDPNGSMQVVKTGGISAAAQPTWNRNPQQDTSDGISWASGGNAQWQMDTQYTEGHLVLDSNGNVEIGQTAGISGEWEPTWNKNFGQTTQDSGMIWKNLGRSTWRANTNFSVGQAIVDSKGGIQIVQVGGTSGASQPTWNEGTDSNGAPLITPDAAVTWTNNRPLIWQPNAGYATGQIIIDSVGNLQQQGPQGDVTFPSGTTQPIWNTIPGKTTQDGRLSWTCLGFNSVDLLQLKTAATQPPYTITFTDSSKTTQTISLINANDVADLQNNGLLHFIARLNAKITQANDILDTGFLTVQTDIYRYRQNVLGSTAASTLATSPLLANIAAGETANATAENLKTYVNSVLPLPGSGPQAPSYTQPVMQPVRNPVVFNNVQGPSMAGIVNPSAQALRARTLAATLGAIKTTSTAATFGSASAIPVVSASPTISARSATPVQAGILGTLAMRVQVVPQTSPAQITIPGVNASATPTDITGQSPLAGAQLNIRTLTIAERLQQSPSQEAMFYSVNNRLGFLQLLEMIENDLEITAADLPILVDGDPPPVPLPGKPPNPVPFEFHTFSEWHDTAKQTAILTKVQSPVLMADSPEATFFSVGVRILEQHTMLLRALEARVQQYVDFVSLCTIALNNIQNDMKQAQALIKQLQNNLLQDRQNVAFTTALLHDEVLRIKNVNAQRLQVLRDSVHLVAYTRGRTIETIDITPSRQLVPANIASPVPACLQQSVAIPLELREIVGMLREAPVSWLPSISMLVSRLERSILLQQLALSAQARAVMQLQLPLLPSSAAGEPGVYAPTISNVYNSNQQLFRSLQSQRSTFQAATLTNLSWSLQVANIQNIIAVNDLIAAEAVHAEISNATSRLIQQISSVATCLYTRVSIALPVDRLGWAEYLRGSGVEAQLRNLAVLPSWNQQSYIDRQQMQMLIDWLFQQIDISNPTAVAFMSDVVRTAILLASEVPLDNIIPGSVIVRSQPTVGGVISLSLPSDRIASGMFVHLFSGANLAAYAVVSDIGTQSASATVTDVFTPGVYLETSDTAHFTAQTPQALAVRPFLMQS